jgi:hypothetical protein
MRKLRIMEHISLDGVIQSSGEDDFPYSDWTAPYRIPTGRDALLAAHGEKFDLLLGRRTYDMWSGFLAKGTEQSDGGRSQCGNKIYRGPSSGKPCMGPVRGPWTGHRRGHSPHQVAGRPGPYPLG